MSRGRYRNQRIEREWADVLADEESLPPSRPRRSEELYRLPLELWTDAELAEQRQRIAAHIARHNGNVTDSTRRRYRRISTAITKREEART